MVTGTAAMFPSPYCARSPAARLDGTLPAGDGRGGVYDTTVLTEDNELRFDAPRLRRRAAVAPEV